MRLLLAAAALAVAVSGCAVPGQTACHRAPHVIQVRLDPVDYPNILGHVARAVRRGQPAVVHVAREQADTHRARALEGIPLRHGYDRDEYPPAMSAEGGKGSDVEYVPSRENRDAGWIMGRALSAYCDGQGFELVAS